MWGGAFPIPNILEPLVPTASMALPSLLIVYCDTPSRFRTIMAYNDAVNCNTPRVNWFSNPDVAYNGIDTGDAAHNNAQCIKDSMVRFLKSTPHVTQLELT